MSAMQSDLATLKERVIEATKASRSSVKIEDVVLESDRDDEGTDFLRVLVQVNPSEKTADADLETLLEAIEDAISAVDERYPSVRFLDAA